MRYLVFFFFSTPLLLSAQATWQDKVSDLLNGMLGDTTRAVALHIVHGGEKNFFLGGLREEGDTLGINQETLFEIGSITKTFTTTLLAKAVSEGKVRLDDPVAHFFPNIENFPGYAKEDTLRLWHLATHTSGFPRLPFNLFNSLSDPNQPYENYGEAELLEALAATELVSSPGEKYLYSNYGVGLLGFILTEVYEQPLEELYREKIFEPLGMERATLRLSEEENYAHAHLGTLEEVPYWKMQDVLAGMGGLKASTGDMASYLIANLRAPTRPIDSILAQTHEKITEQTSLGWHHLQRDGFNLIWHNGGTGGSKSFMAFDKEKQLGIVLLFNTNVADSTWTPNFEAMLALDILKMVEEGRE